jgi:hypothetical protein
MIRQKSASRIIFISVLGMLLACDQSMAQSARIEAFSGKVELQREGQTRRPLKPEKYGNPFHLGDLLIFAKGASVELVCPAQGNQLKHETFKSPESGVERGFRQLCPSFVSGLVKDPPPPGLLGGITADVPYIISPRHTLLLSDRPTLQWNAVPGATHYTVRLMGEKGIVWEQTKVQTTTIRYNGQPPLGAGQRYSLMVTAHPGKSSILDGTVGVDFIILRQPEAEAIQAELEAIKQVGLSEAMTALKLADVYADYTLPNQVLESYGLSKTDFKSYHLTTAAIDTLQSLIKDGQESPEIYRMLGDMYWQSGLALLARDAYLRSIDLASSLSVEDREERLMAQERLGDIFSALQDSSQAVSWYSRARVNYLLLGDEQRASGLQQKILAMQRQKQM